MGLFRFHCLHNKFVINLYILYISLYPYYPLNICIYPLFWKNIGALFIATFFEISTLYHISLFLTVRFVIFQINTKFQINHLKKYFYTLHLSLISRKKSALYRRNFQKQVLFTTVLSFHSGWGVQHFKQILT